MKVSINSLICLLFPFVLYAQNENIGRIDGLDSIITKVLEDWNVPGCAVTIVEKNRTIYKRGFGYSDLKTKKKVDENTIFQLASCTKAFTSSLIGILQSEGKIDINKPAHSFLPSLEFIDPKLNREITVCNMLTHTTGIPRHDNSWYGHESVSRDSLIGLIKYFDKANNSNNGFLYNNYMYAALGLMAQTVNESISWEQQVEQKIFTPLSMRRSLTNLSELTAYDNIAYPHEITFDLKPIEVPITNCDNMAPCGSICSSAKDISNWLITLINGGRFGLTQIIPSSYFQESITPQWRREGEKNSNINYLGYGYGWNVSEYRTHRSIHHGGNSDGVASLVLFLPDDSLGISIFINSRTTPVPMILANYICDYLLCLPAIDWSSNKLLEFKAELVILRKEYFKNKRKIIPDTILASGLCGNYFNPGYGYLKLFNQGDSISGSYGILKIWLKHRKGYEFDAVLYKSDFLFGKIDAINRPLTFHKDDRGAIEGLSILLERNSKPTRFVKK